MRFPILAVLLVVPAGVCLAVEDSDTDRYWRPEMRIGPNKAGPQIFPKDEAKAWRPPEPTKSVGETIDKRLATCLATQSKYQANSYFAPSFKTNLVAAVGTLLGKCSAAVDEWEAQCVGSGDTSQSCEMKSALLATKALKDAGAQ